jgi:hypothetical protein
LNKTTRIALTGWDQEEDRRRAQHAGGEPNDKNEEPATPRRFWSKEVVMLS